MAEGDAEAAKYMEMFRPKSQQETTEEPKVTEKLLHLQFARYTRRLKIAKTEKLSRLERATCNVVKYRLEKMKQDQVHLIDEGSMCISKKERKIENRFLPRLATLIQENAYLEDEIETLKKNMRDLDKATYKLMGRVKERETKYATQKARTEKESDDRFMAMLQRKVSTAMIEFNKTMEACKVYRCDIEILLRERHKFNVATERLFNRVSCGKVLMMDLMEQALEAFEKREEAHEELKCMQEKCHVYNDGKSKQSKQMQKFKQLLQIEVSKAIFQSIKTQIIVMGDYATNQRMVDLMEMQRIEEQNFRTQLLLYKIKYLLDRSTVGEAIQAFVSVNNEATSIYRLAVTLFCHCNELSKHHRLLQYTCEQIHIIHCEWIEKKESQMRKLKDEMKDAKRSLENWIKHNDSVWSWVMITFRKLEQLAYKVGAPLRTMPDGQPLEVTQRTVDTLLKDIELGVADLTTTLSRVESTVSEDSLPLGKCLIKTDVADEVHPVSALAIRAASQLPTPCAVCSEMNRIAITREIIDTVLPYEDMQDEVKATATAGALHNLVHSVHDCSLPGSTRFKVACRQIAAKRVSCV